MNSTQLALRALLVIAQRGGIRLSELASELQVARSTAHRILTNCVAAGYVRQESAGARYEPGPHLYEIALRMASTVDLNRAIAPALEAVHRRFGYTTNFSALEGRYARVLLSLVGTGPRPVSSQMGSIHPAHADAAGKAMLAFCTPEDLNARLSEHHLVALTPRTVTDRHELIRQLEITRERGWAVAFGEGHPDVDDAAVPVLGLSGEALGAISVAAWAPRLQARAELAELIGAMQDAASQIQWALGAGAGSAAPGEASGGLREPEQDAVDDEGDELGVEGLVQQ